MTQGTNVSRTTTPDQLTIPSRNIFVTQVRQTDGTLRSVISSQALSKQSVGVNCTWQGEIWLSHEEFTPGKYRKKYVSGRCSNRGALFLLLRLLQSNSNIYQNGGSCLFNYNIWGNIVSWIVGVNFNFHDNEIKLINNYALATTPHQLEHHQQFGIFLRAKMDPAIVVDAAIRGQEDMVLNILRTDPSYLLQSAIVENVVDVKSIRTPLQAAITANDVQLIERMKEHFTRLTTDLDGKPINGLAEMQKQIKAIYTESLTRYCWMQQEKIDALQAAGNDIDPKTVRTAQENLKAYSDALASNDLNTLVKAHDRAQADNTFDFQPYIDAICNAPQAELDEVMTLIDADTEEKTQAAIAKGVSPIEIGFTDQYGKAYTREEVQALPFSELTLLQKMNHFREKLVEHRRQEIISNLYHILKSAEHNDHIWDEVRVNSLADPNYEKRSIICSQVYGFAQVTAEEPVRQDLRQGAFYLVSDYFTEENPQPRRRPSDFNYLPRKEYRDDSLDDRLSVSGWGYKFDSGTGLAGRCRRGSARGSGPYFQILCQKEKQRFQNLLCSFRSASASLNSN